MIQLSASEHTHLTTVIESYIQYYASGDGHTARAKRLDLEHFLQFLTKHCSVSDRRKLRLQDMDHSNINRFVEDCLRKGEAPSTVARRLATLKHMGRTLAEKLAGFTNPAREVKAPKIPTPRPKALSSIEVHKIEENAKKRTGEKNSFTRYRNQVLFLFLLDTGLRAEEVRLLRAGQLDDSLEWIHNVRTKGKRYRNVYISKRMRPLLKEYLEKRTHELLRFFEKVPVKVDRLLPVFPSNYRAKPQDPDSFLMGAKSIWRAINELSSDTPLHPHLLRHSYATELLESSKDVRLVSQALGHSDVRITMRYTERSDQEVAKAIEKKSGPI